MKKSEIHQIQMVREIKIQRKMRMCANSIRLYGVYETDKYINLVMEY
jgi:serine/threonine protein kinase